MPWVEDDEYEVLRAIRQEAEQIVEEPLMPWSDAQRAAYDKLCDLLHPDESGE